MEYQTCLHTGRRAAEELASNDDDDDDVELEAEYTTGGSEDLWWERCAAVGATSKAGKAVVFGKSKSMLSCDSASFLTDPQVPRSKALRRVPSWRISWLALCR